MLGYSDVNNFYKSFKRWTVMNFGCFKEKMEGNYQNIGEILSSD